MKRIVLILALLCIATAVYGRAPSRPLVEIGPKSNLYITDNARIGFGVEILFSPMRGFSLRTELAELSFGGDIFLDDGTVFTLNHWSTIDGLVYIPMRSVLPYVHAGMGFRLRPDWTNVSIRAGMGFNYSIKRNIDIFVEPGLMIYITDISGFDDTDVTFRLSFGGRFGIVR